MKTVHKFSLFAGVCLAFLAMSAGADELRLYTDQVPPAEEMAEILFPELVGEKKTGVKTRSIQFGLKKKKIEPISIGMPINFDYASYELQEAALPFLDQIGLMMNMEKLADQKIIIEGHTDATGPEAYNYELSRKRAEAVKNYLLRKYNIAPNRLVISAKGEKEILPGRPPVDPMNRRVVFKRGR